MATRKRKTRKRSAGSVSKHRTHRRRRSVGAVGSVGKRHRKRRRSVGAVGGVMNTGTLKSITTMALGLAGGAIVTHMALRPLENKLTATNPKIAKFLGAGEILLGGILAIKAKQPLVKGVGLGIMANGVSTVMKQLKINHPSPALAGAEDYTTVRVPISGSLENMLSGMITDRTSYVAGDSEISGVGDGDISGIAGIGDISGPSSDIYKTYLLAGVGVEEQDFLRPIGI